MYYRYYTKQFQKSLNRIISSGKIKRREVEDVVDILSRGHSLSSGYKDHSLNGELSKYRECHIQSDLLLIYKIEKENLILILIDIGSH